VWGGLLGGGGWGGGLWGGGGGGGGGVVGGGGVGGGGRTTLVNEILAASVSSIARSLTDLYWKSAHGASKMEKRPDQHIHPNPGEGTMELKKEVWEELPKKKLFRNNMIPRERRMGAAQKPHCTATEGGLIVRIERKTLAEKRLCWSLVVQTAGGRHSPDTTLQPSVRGGLLGPYNRFAMLPRRLRPQKKNSQKSPAVHDK